MGRGILAALDGHPATRADLFRGL